MRRDWIVRIAAAMLLALAAHAAAADNAEPIALDAETDAATFCGRVQAAFTRGNFVALEATAARARPLERRFPGGKTELQVFYDSLVNQSCYPTNNYQTEDAGRTRVALGERWLGQNPDSETAKIANAMIWAQFAWLARGSGFADQVSQEQWAVFSDRLKRAAQFMRSVNPDDDAEAYLILLQLARDLGVPRAQIDTIFRRARERFPTFLDYYADYASILMPKWFGQPGEVADYMKSLLDEPGGDVGAMAYSRAAERIAWEMGSSSVYRDAGLSWDSVRRGFALRESGDGLEKINWTVLCYYAVMANDRDTAREAYRHITHIDGWPVGGTHQFFLTVLPWIMDRS